METRVECARKYLSLVRNKFRDQPGKYEEFLTVMKSFKEQKHDTETVCKKVQDLFKGHKSLLTEFNKLIPSSFRIDIESRPRYQEAIDYMRRVKEETKDSPGVYTEFISVLKKYQNKIVSIEEVNCSVKVIMADYPNLIESFKIFLPCSAEISSSEDDDEFDPIPFKPLRKKSSSLAFEKILTDVITEPINKNEISYFKRLKKVMDLNSLPGTDYFLELVKCFELYSDSIITKTELANMVEPLFKLTSYSNFLSSQASKKLPKDENREVSSYIQCQLAEMFDMLKSIASSRESSRRKYGWFFRPLSDFDTSKCKRHGHSYLEIQRPRVLKDSPNSEISGQWISVPYGSEDVSFRNFRKNAFEDALFKCEDERFELDMATESASYTLRVLENALEEANKLTQEQQKNFALDESVFSKFRMRPIQNIYSEHCGKLIEMLRNNPVRALPVVISRIKSKIENWKKSNKSDSERVWKEIVERNFYKSLDHRSFYFKQNEKKMTNPKSFLSDAKTRHQNREESKITLRKYLKKELTHHSFEFLGGSRNTLFFNSFSGLCSGVVHKIRPQFVDDVVEEFQVLDTQEKKSLYINAPEYATLPHFRLLFTCQKTVFDAIRIILFALEKSSPHERVKIDRWLSSLFKDFMGLSLPADIVKYKFEEFFEVRGASERQDEPRDGGSGKKAGNKGTNSSIYSNSDVGGSCLSENLQDPMNLKKDESFVGFLPLLKNHQVMYAPGTVYSFIRFFYDIYERLLKVKLVLSKIDQDSNNIEFGDYVFDSSIESEYYGFLKTVCSVIKGTCDSSKFEDKCRNLLGNFSYVFFTFDKLVGNAAKSLQTLAVDEYSAKAAALHSRFSKCKLNEEMYFSEFLAVSPQSQVFRLHWNGKYKIICVTYIESPYEKISEQAVKNNQKYRKQFLTAGSQVNAVDDLKVFLQKIENYLRNREFGLAEYAGGLFYYQDTRYGMVENSLKFFYISGGEEFLANVRFYGHNLIVEAEDSNFLCLDKNSAFQKYSEVSGDKFKLIRDEWLNKFN